MNRRRTATLATGVAAFLCLAAAGFRVYGRSGALGESEADALVMLIPDAAPPPGPRVQVWRDAALEEGLHLRVMRDAEFQRRCGVSLACAGVILPDQVHKVASDALVRSLERYVQRGGQLMVVYDAATWSMGRTYAPGRCRLSPLVGVDYALYERYGAGTIASGPVIGTPAVMQALRVPPGKFAPVGTDEPALPDDTEGLPEGGLSAVSQRLPVRTGPPLLTAAGPNRLCAVTGYVYGTLRYPHFVTEGSYPGQVLLSSPEQHLIAGLAPAGKGRVLFVNLPLGYLKGRTDGLFLHGFLHYFARDLLGLPQLASVPDGTPGMVMNWHLDSNATLKPLTEMARLGVYQQGPYSIHITAGPDTRAPGDGLGLNVPANAAIQQQIRFMLARGYAIGSHGGWIHDYFGRGVREDNEAEFAPYLELNKQALERVTGKPVLEYSAPVGNQPEWVTTWLEARGVLAYYFTGNSGMGPTRSYREGALANSRIWSFPFLPYGKVACFEEMRQAGVPDARIARWCESVTDFCARQRVSRLVYFHPPGALLYPIAMRAWLARAAAWAGKGRFRWYTMTALATFLNAREQVTWCVTTAPGGQRVVEAVHPESLQHQTWALPRRAYTRPVITQGQAIVREQEDDWLVIATGGKRLRFVAGALAP